MPNSSQMQTNKTKETHQLTLSFVSKSWPSKKDPENLFTLKFIVSNLPANFIDGMSQLFQCWYSRLFLSWSFKWPGDLLEIEKVRDIENLTKWAVFRKFNTI